MTADKSFIAIEDSKVKYSAEYARAHCIQGYVATNIYDGYKNNNNEWNKSVETGTNFEHRDFSNLQKLMSAGTDFFSTALDTSFHVHLDSPTEQ